MHSDDFAKRMLMVIVVLLICIVLMMGDVYFSIKSGRIWSGLPQPAVVGMPSATDRGPTLPAFPTQPPFPSMPLPAGEGPGALVGPPPPGSSMPMPPGMMPKMPGPGSGPGGLTPMPLGPPPPHDVHPTPKPDPERQKPK